jgi:hypothetical protein
VLRAVLSAVALIPQQNLRRSRSRDLANRRPALLRRACAFHPQAAIQAQFPIVQPCNATISSPSHALSIPIRCSRLLRSRENYRCLLLTLTYQKTSPTPDAPSAITLLDSCINFICSQLRSSVLRPGLHYTTPGIASRIAWPIRRTTDLPTPQCSALSLAATVQIHPLRFFHSATSNQPPFLQGYFRFIFFCFRFARGALDVIAILASTPLIKHQSLSLQLDIIAYPTTRFRLIGCCVNPYPPSASSPNLPSSPRPLGGLRSFAVEQRSRKSDGSAIRRREIATAQRKPEPWRTL